MKKQDDFGETGGVVLTAPGTQALGFVPTLPTLSVALPHVIDWSSLSSPRCPVGTAVWHLALSPIARHGRHGLSFSSFSSFSCPWSLPISFSFHSDSFSRTRSLSFRAVKCQAQKLRALNSEVVAPRLRMTATATSDAAMLLFVEAQGATPKGKWAPSTYKIAGFECGIEINNANKIRQTNTQTGNIGTHGFCIVHFINFNYHCRIIVIIAHVRCAS